MSTDSYTPRIKRLDVAFVTEQLKSREEVRAETEARIREQPKKGLQWDMASLCSHCKSMAYYKYALGYPVEEIRQTFGEAATACLKVFELRGTMDDPQTYPPLPHGTKDYSFTNSKACFEGICIALIAAQYEIADKLTELMWDPPKARYIGPRSEVCTITQQHLAYAVKHLLLNQMDDAQKELRRFVWRSSEAGIAKMVRGLAEKNDAIFVEGLLELLFWHRKEANESYEAYNRDYSETYFSLPAAALSNLAVKQCLLKRRDLPADEYLPLELVADQ
ncbi:MAG: hypothetical protein HY040_12420 [Planctomycetes bacterium]|nr:hypothetical protein [Planctomycetota bacterium]